MRDYTADAQALQGEITKLRHTLHAHPETGNDLPWTQQVVLDALAGLDLEVTPGNGSTSITAVIRARMKTGAKTRKPMIAMWGRPK